MSGDGNISSKDSPGTTNLSDDSGDAAAVQQQVDEAILIAESPKRNIREELGFNQDDDNEDGARTAFAVPSTAEEIEGETSHNVNVPIILFCNCSSSNFL